MSCAAADEPSTHAQAEPKSCEREIQSLAWPGKLHRTPQRTQVNDDHIANRELDV
jgi:hypothetical protein